MSSGGEMNNATRVAPNGFRLRVVFVVFLAVAGMFSSALMPSWNGPAAQPLSDKVGGIFVTGHDPDYHGREKPSGASNIVRRAVGYVTGNKPNPKMLVVASRITPPPGHEDPVPALSAMGYRVDVAAAPHQGALDLSTVNFRRYDVVVVSSDFGGLLRQAELDILNARRAELKNYVNEQRGGVVAFAESNGHSGLTPRGGHFQFVLPPNTSTPLQQHESDFKVSLFGHALVGLANSDINGNFSHNVFESAPPGYGVVDRDSQGRTVSLAARQVVSMP